MSSPTVAITAMSHDAAAQSLARDMIEVHGEAAAAIARDNARLAAIGAQLPKAKRWLKVLDLIQRRQRVEATITPCEAEFPSVISSKN